MMRRASNNWLSPLRHPGEAVWSRARRDTAGHGPGFEIDNGHVVVAVHGDECACPVWSDQNALGRASKGDAFDFLARGRVENDQIARVEIRDQRKLAIARQ